MASLLYSECGRWIDENGDEVFMVKSPLGGLFYIDKISRELNKIYDPYRKVSVIGGIGSSGLENFANKICFLFPVMESFGGFDKKSLDEFAGAYQHTSASDRLIHYEYMKTKKIAGITGIFPTEKLISSCFKKWKRC